MADPTQRLARRPEARAVPVEELVDRVLTGRIRIPAFQRPLRWSGEDVRALLDSLWRGYPVGALLLWRRPAPAVEHHAVGPLILRHAPPVEDAWWVVDGQQRLLALAASLGQAEGAPPDEVFDAWFDTESDRFVGARRDGAVPDGWVPLRVMLDASRLQDWLFEWKLGRDVDRRKAALDAGNRIRSYQIPVYVIDAEDDAVLREVFRRVNRSGRPLTETEVFDALYGTSDPSSGTDRLAELADLLSDEGWGRLPPRAVLQALVAMAGHDVTRRIDEVEVDADEMRALLRSGHVPLREAVRFLRETGEIPHQRLLPFITPVVVLGTFFSRFPDPPARVRTNLARWLWRATLRGGLADAPVRRATVAVVQRASDAEQAAAALARRVAGPPPAAWQVPERFDARDAQTRIALLGLATLQPRHVVDGRRLHVPHLLDQHGEGAFRAIHRGASWSGVGHRLLHPPLQGLRREVLARIGSAGGAGEDEVLASHGLQDVLAAATDADVFRARERRIEQAVRELSERLAAWERSDRPSIAYLAASGEGS